MMHSTQAKSLLERYRTGNCSPDEKQLVEQWYAQLVETGEWQWSEGEKEQLEQIIESRLMQTINKKVTPVYHPLRTIRMTTTKWWWAAASILLIASIGVYFMIASKAKQSPSIAQTQAERFKNDITPAKQQVILTLSDGSTKVLDSVSNGTVTLQGTTQAVKGDGSIAYLGNHSSEVIFNTITTEKGRTFHLQLADGTDVWLDALSSIHFPTTFPGGDRIVEITGQAYFEVAKNPGKPFKVKSGNQVIEVVGTHFNVNSFNQGDYQTTLLEGSVKVIANNGSPVFIKPGEQARVDNNGSIKITTDTDLDEVMAWKNGRFQFNGSSVDEIMNQLSRWYNIDVVYKDKITETFVADIKRDLPVSKLLALLEMTKQIKFVIEGNKVTVMKW